MTRLTASGIRRRLALAAGVAVWAVAVLAGSRVLLNFEGTPGLPGAPPRHWPAAGLIARSNTAHTLVVLAHPDCPCTRATLVELASIMAQLRGKVISYVIFSKPDASGGDVKESELWHAAARIPGVTPIFDPQSIETERFGGHVSGQTILYDPKGNLVFSGGITSARGHEGDNDGADAILRGVTGQKGSLASTPVFGCSLHNPGASPRNEDPSWNGR